MKNKEIIQRVQSAYSKGVHSDDSRLRSRHIYSKLKTVRSRLLVLQQNKKQSLSPWNYQTLPCVELIRVPDNLCPCVPPNGCTILRSRYKLPRPLKGLYSSGLQSVATLSRITINEVAIKDISYLKENKYTSKSWAYFVQDGYLYIVSDIEIKLLTVTGLFDDPVEALIFKSFCDAEDCSGCLDLTEQEFPLDGDLIEVAIEMAGNELIGNFQRAREDTRNNTEEDGQ